MARCERVQRVLQQWMVRACSGAPDSLLPFYRNARAMQRQGRQGNAPWHSKRRRRTCTSCWQPISGCPALSVQPTRNNIAIGPCQPRLPALPQLHLPRSERRLRCIAARLVEHSSSMFAKAAQALCLLLLASAASAYPNLFTSMHANACGDQPTSALGSHGAPRPDSGITFDVSSSAGWSSKTLCPGGQYNVKVNFPTPRLALLTTSVGAFTTSASEACPNRVLTGSKSPTGSMTTTLSVPCSAAGSNAELKLTTAEGASAAFKTASTSIPVGTADGACASQSASCKSGGNGLVPVTPSKFDPNQPNSVVDANTLAGAGQGPMAPVYTWRPILQGNKVLWQFLHSVLMLASFGFLMPLGTLLARHKWMFGRSPTTGKVMGGWFWLHILAQLLAVLAAAAGVVIAILAFGWKSVPGEKLYAPHKWTGIGVMGMALIQLVTAPFRPKLESKRRGCWNFVHHVWGRVAVLGGMGNCILGAILVHDYKGESYISWLVPCCAVIGFVCLLGLVMEAFKIQMQRTYRYHHKTQNMLPVMEGGKRSKRRNRAGEQPQQQGANGVNGVEHEADPSYPSVRHYEDGADAAKAGQTVV